MCGSSSLFDYKINNTQAVNTQQQPSSFRSRFPLCFEDSPRMKSGEMKITSVQPKVTAKVAEVNLDHGFVEHFIEKEVLLKTITKNGAKTVPENNGRILFHKNEVSGPMQELKVGEMVEFNLVHVKTNNRIIAQRVAKVVSDPYQQDEEAKQLAHFLRSELPRTFTAPEQPKMVYVKDNVIGKLCELKIMSNGTGHAFLTSKATPEADTKIFLHFSQLIGTDMSVLKVGDNFKFKMFKNNHNGRFIARSCQYLQPGQLISDSANSAQSVETIGHFQFMEAPKLTSSIQLPKFTPMLTYATGTVHSTVLAQRCGFVNLDAQFCMENGLVGTGITADTKIFFHENNMVGQVLSEMLPNDRVMFTLQRNNENGKFVAKSIESTTLAAPATGQSGSAINCELASSSKLSTGMNLAKSIWSDNAPMVQSSGKGMNNNLKPYSLINKNVSLLNESEKRRRSVETLNKISASNVKSSHR